jgi:Flp pilus assembly protein TadD
VEAELRRAIAIQPDYPDLHVALARSHRAGGALEDARDAYRRALELAPRYDVAALELALVELALGSPASAEARLVDLLERRSDWPDVHALLGRIRLLQGNAEGAEAPLRAAIAASPNDSATLADLGWVLRSLGRDAEAGEAFARALELSPGEAAPRQQLEWRGAFGRPGGTGT